METQLDHSAWRRPAVGGVALSYLASALFASSVRLRAGLGSITVDARGGCTWTLALVDGGAAVRSAACWSTT